MFKLLLREMAEWTLRLVIELKYQKVIMLVESELRRQFWKKIILIVYPLRLVRLLEQM